MAGKLPARIGRYRVLCELGHGGMAVLYLARAVGPAGFERLFAIKTIHEQLTRDRSFIDMFLDEARLAARIHHPNAVGVYDIGEDNGLHYIAMDYVNGETLAHTLGRTWKQNPPFPIALGVHVAESVCEALHAAHELTDAKGQPLGVVHRDVSPQNIMIGYDGIARIMDFGVAKAADRLTNTRAGAQKGKVAYMAPEQIRGESIDRRADIFAMGVVLWETLAGKRLFKAANDFATAERVKKGRIAPIKKFRADVPPRLIEIVDRCLSRDPKDRFPTARELGRELHDFAIRESATRSAEDVERFMKTSFPDRFAQRQEVARRATEADPSLDPQPLSTGESGSISGSISGFDGVSPPSGTHPEIEAATFAPDVPAPNRTRVALMAAAIAVTAASVVFTLLAKDEVEPTRIVPVMMAPAPVPIEEIRLEFEVEPVDAVVQIDGRPVVGSLLMPRSTIPLQIEVTAPGRNPYTRTLIPDRSHVLAVKLEPKVEPPKVQAAKVERPRPVRAAVKARGKRLLLKGDEL